MVEPLTLCAPDVIATPGENAAKGLFSLLCRRPAMAKHFDNTRQYRQDEDARRGRFWRRRWIVKDLAQLAYSAPRERVSCSRRLAFFKAYLGVRKLRARDKRLLRSVLRKQWLMEFKLGPHP